MLGIDWFVFVMIFVAAILFFLDVRWLRTSISYENREVLFNDLVQKYPYIAWLFKRLDSDDAEILKGIFVSSDLTEIPTNAEEVISFIENRIQSRMFELDKAGARDKCFSDEQLIKWESLQNSLKLTLIDNL